MCGLYLTRLGDTEEQRGLDPLTDRLEPTRRKALEAVKHREARSRSLCAHLLTRVLACRTLGISNSGLLMGTGAQGKPYLPDYPDFHFSISHTRDAVAVAVNDRPVGVDLEQVRPVDLRIAKRFFTVAEQAELDRWEQDKAVRFLEMWTGKEACVKWQGGTMVQALGSLDVLSPVWRERLWTGREGNHILSLCSDPNPAVDISLLPLGELIRQASRLAVFDKDDR